MFKDFFRIQTLFLTWGISLDNQIVFLSEKQDITSRIKTETVSPFLLKSDSTSAKNSANNRWLKCSSLQVTNRGFESLPFTLTCVFTKFFKNARIRTILPLTSKITTFNLNSYLFLTLSYDLRITVILMS